MIGYKKGRRFEYKVRDLLRQFGFYVVRSAKSAFPDLVALGKNGTLLVECKVGKYLKPTEKIAMGEFYQKYCAMPFKAYPAGKIIIFENLALPNDIREFKANKKGFVQMRGAVF